MFRQYGAPDPPKDKVYRRLPTQAPDALSTVQRSVWAFRWPIGSCISLTSWMTFNEVMAQVQGYITTWRIGYPPTEDQLREALAELELHILIESKTA